MLYHLHTPNKNVEHSPILPASLICWSCPATLLPRSSEGTGDVLQNAASCMGAWLDRETLRSWKDRGCCSPQPCSASSVWRQKAPGSWDSLTVILRAQH